MPVCVHYFKNELFIFPSIALKQKYKNLKSFALEPYGGHFASFENYKVSADNLISFIQKLLND